jgi:hypothetical protein
MVRDMGEPRGEDLVSDADASMSAAGRDRPPGTPASVRVGMVSERPGDA